AIGLEVGVVLLNGFEALSGQQQARATWHRSSCDLLVWTFICGSCTLREISVHQFSECCPTVSKAKAVTTPVAFASLLDQGRATSRVRFTLHGSSPSPLCVRCAYSPRIQTAPRRASSPLSRP